MAKKTNKPRHIVHIYQPSDEEIRLRTLELVKEQGYYPREYLVAYSIQLINYVKNGYYPKFNGKEDFNKQVTEEMLLHLHKQVADELINLRENSPNLSPEPSKQSDTSDSNANHNTKPRKPFFSFLSNLFSCF